MKVGFRILFMFILVAMVGCTKINSTETVQTNPNSGWGISAFTNNTDVPQAGYKAMNITAGVLRSKGVRSLSVHPAHATCNKLISCPNATPSVSEVLTWGRHEHLQYVMMGAVNEWDYKVGLDGEPIVSVSLQLYNVNSGTMIWSSVGSKIGSSRSGLTVIAQALMDEMLSRLKIS